MRRSALTMIVIALLATAWTADAWARAGGGASGGSRGSRSYSAPARPAPSPTTPSRPASPPSSFQQPTPQRSPWGGLLGGLGGLMLGGLIGSLFFGGLGHGPGGGIGLLEILLIAGLAYVAFSFMRRRAPQPAGPAGYAPVGGDWKPEPVSLATATAELPPAAADLDRGLGHIRQMDTSFDEAGFTEAASDIFFRLQAAWMSRDLTPVRARLTDEMHALLERDSARLRAEGRVNRLESIAVRSVDVTEAWQEGGQDFVTVCFRASVVDYTTDESGTRLLEGSRTEPVKFEEYWTFVRPVGPNPWRLSAIHQPA